MARKVGVLEREAGDMVRKVDVLEGGGGDIVRAKSGGGISLW